MIPEDLVHIDQYGLLGTNYYWHKFANHGLSKEDITEAGLTDDRVQVSEKIVRHLQEVDEELQSLGWRLYIKEGYRSSALYDIVYKRRVEKHGKQETDSLFNLASKPHALGLTVDVSIWDPQTNSEVMMRKREDGTPALFIGFYKSKSDEESKRYQELQDYIAGLMLKRGFRIGTKREYFHFDYRPDMPENYDRSR
jgi:D-alanyl-D-alanine dipeptidase